MDPELNESQEPSADDLAAAEAAFASGFGATDEPQPSKVEPEASAQPTKTAAAAEPSTEPAAEPTAKAEPTPVVVDPYAGLPDVVKAALAEIPTLQSELRRTTGQVRSLQSAHDRAVAAAAQAAEAPAPRSKAREQVEENLPEVITTINEIVEQHLKQKPAAAPAAPAIEVEPQDETPPEVRALDTGFPQWREIAGSNDFRLFVAAQPDGQAIRATKDPVVLMSAITRFEKHRTALSVQDQEAERQKALRQSRVDASLTPTRGAGRRPTHTQTEEDAFAAGFAGR